LHFQPRKPLRKFPSFFSPNDTGRERHAMALVVASTQSKRHCATNSGFLHPTVQQCLFFQLGGEL
jgi:hypothetical protein